MSEALSAKSQRIADEPLTVFEAAEKLGWASSQAHPWEKAGC